MLFDVLTGALSAFFILLTLLYPFRRKIKAPIQINKLKFHCISGCLLLFVTIIHINFKILSPSFSFGFLTLAALIMIAVTGFLKRRFMKAKFLYYFHILFVGIFILAFLIHAAQQIINLLIM